MIKMKTLARIIEVSRIAEITFDGLLPDKAKEQISMMLKHNSQKINFKLPEKDKSIIIDVYQIG